MALLGGHAEDLAALVGAAVRTHMVRLLQAAAHGARLNRGEDRLLQLSDALALPHFRLFVFR